MTSPRFSTADMGCLHFHTFIGYQKEHTADPPLRAASFRAGADDKPLRMVKTVLHELVKLKGIEIKAHLSLVPGVDLGGHPGRDQPIIMAYIDLNLQTMPAAPPPPRQEASPPACESTPPATPPPVTLEQIVKPQLAVIFNKVKGEEKRDGE